MNTPSKHLFLIYSSERNRGTMTNKSMALANQDSKELQTKSEWSRDQIDLLKHTVCKGATDDEFKIFCYAVQRTGLDPFMKQIHAVKRWNTKSQREDITIQVGIDGYRLIAERTGLYAGNDDTVFDNEKEPNKATHTVYKMVQGARCGFTASARWSEYYPGDKQGFMWKKMPCVMLGKVAETLALRKAFPAELSGLYTNEEMAQAGPEANQYKQQHLNMTAPEVKNPSEAQLKRLFAISKQSQVSQDQIKDYMMTEFKKTSTKDLTIEEYNKICDDMQNGFFTQPAQESEQVGPTDESSVIDEMSAPQVSNEVPWAKYREQ